MLLLASCGGLGSSSDDSDTAELSLNKKVKGTISKEGEVDWYRFRAVDANALLQVKCTSETLRPEVDLLVGVYQEDTNGNKVLIYADHAPDGGMSPADLTLHAYIDVPKDIYISVRDLMDDDFSDNPYYISVDMEASAEENDSFTTATTLAVDDGMGASDNIGRVGDIDCYQFTSTGGVYDVNVEFTPFAGTSVQLSVDLYDSEGNIVGSQTSATRKSYHLIHFLPAGLYFVHIDDYGMNDFDTASTYTVFVNTVTADEANENDSSSQAETVNMSSWNTDVTITGTIAYAEDKDYYLLSLPSPLDGFRVLELSFFAASSFEYNIHLLDQNLNTVFSQTYKGGSTLFHTLLKLESGNAYLVIEPVTGTTGFESSSYTATLQVQNIVDDADTTPNENDTIDTADTLTPSSNPASATSGKISYRGDADWYSLTIAAHASPQILEVFVNAPLSSVAYALTVIGDSVNEKIYNSHPETIPTQLKTSFLVSANDESAVYSFRVGDFQDDDGDDAAYTIRVDLKDIPPTLPAVAQTASPYGATVAYYNEVNDTGGNEVTLEYNPVTKKTFNADTTRLDFANATVEQNTPADGQTRLTFPWIGGYIDYQGDQDWFMIDFQPLDSSSTWYYELSVEFYAPSTDVEYVWKFYPDRNDNDVMAEQSSGYDGFIASAGDTGISEAAFDITTPAQGDSDFWVGRSWQGQAFFSISDFNYLYDETEADNTVPDDDWGGYGQAPYYFRLTLIYHPGVSNP